MDGKTLPMAYLRTFKSNMAAVRNSNVGYRCKKSRRPTKNIKIIRLSVAANTKLTDFIKVS